MLVCYLFLPLCHVIFSRRCLFLMLHLITSRFQLILQTMKPRSMTAWTHEPQLRNTLTVLLPDLLLHVSTYLAKNTRNQVEGQLWRHLMQLRDTLTVLLPDWYAQAKIARLSHKRENWSNIVPKLRSCGFISTNRSVEFPNFLHQCRWRWVSASWVQVSAKFAIIVCIVCSEHRCKG